MAIKCLEMRVIASRLMEGAKPRAAALSATLNTDGLPDPLASGGVPVLTMQTPCWMASSTHSGPRPVLQWVWNSTGMSPVCASTAGTRVRVRSGLSSPPGSLMQIRVGLIRAASRASSA